MLRYNSHFNKVKRPSLEDNNNHYSAIMENFYWICCAGERRLWSVIARDGALHILIDFSHALMVFTDFLGRRHLGGWRIMLHDVPRRNVHNLAQCTRILIAFYFESFALTWWSLSVEIVAWQCKPKLDLSQKHHDNVEHNFISEVGALAGDVVITIFYDNSVADLNNRSVHNCESSWS